jgi:hypothetical protein
MPQEPPPTPPPVAMTFESLSDRLREGPLRTLLTLHVRAGMLAGDEDTDDAQRLDKLVELVQLARVAMAQFHDFTLELQGLIDHLSKTNGKVQ